MSKTVSRRHAAAGFLLFLLIGAIQALYGPVLPALRATFHLSAASGGLIVSAHFLGAMAGILLAGAVAARITLGPRLAGGSVLLVLGCLGLALTPIWLLALASACAVGIGFGVLVIEYNTLFAGGFGPRSAAMLNLINASYGIGAILGPVVVGWVSPSHYAELFLAAAVLVAAILPLQQGVAAVSASPSREKETFRVVPLVLVLFLLFFPLYEGIETNMGAWEAFYLEVHGLPASGAALLVSAFWAAMTLGRILVAPLSVRISPDRLVIGALVGVIVMLAVAQSPAAAPAALPLTGLVLAPVFPVSLLWLSRRLPSLPGGLSIAIAITLLGGSLFSAAMGRAIDATSPQAFPIGLLVIACAALAVAIVLRRTEPATR